MAWNLLVKNKKEKYISFFRWLLLTTFSFLVFISFAFPNIANAEDTTISTVITDVFNGIKGKFVIQNINFNAVPQVSITVNPCVTASGCMSSDNPKFDCRANRWVISINGGMPPIRIPSVHEKAKALLVQVEGMLNILRENLPDSPGVEIGTYDPKKGGWTDDNLFKDSINLKIKEAIEMSVNLSNNTAEAIKKAIGKNSSYIDADGEICGPGIDETTGDKLQRVLLESQNLINSISNTLQVKIVWQLPDNTSIENIKKGINNINITVGGNKISVPSPAPAQPLFYQQNQANLQSLSNLHLASRNSDKSQAILSAVKDFYGYAIAAQRGIEEANQYIEKRKKENATSSPQSSSAMFKLVFHRLMNFVAAAEEEIHLSQAMNDLQNSLKIPFVEIDALNAIRHLAIYNLPVFVAFTNNDPDAKIIHGAVVLDYNPSNDMFIIFSTKKGLAKISWDALMSSQPRFIVGILENKQ